ncbi:MAG: helix-turn-helix domain-containing protein [Bacteroidetes bacterium]|nr:helix-turn-helix domain-containing protein [Bacteroidota bacterium]
MSIIPVHDLMIKDLQHAEFDIIPLNGVGERNYDGVIPHRHNFYEFFVFTEGGGIHELDFNDHKIKASSLHFVSPTQVHKLKANQSKGFVLCFTGDIIPFRNKNESFAAHFPFYDFNSSQPYLQVPKKLFHEIFQMVNSIYETFNSNHPFKIDIIRSYLNIILLKVKQFFIEHAKGDENKNMHRDVRVTDFIKLIDKLYADQLSVQEYSEKLNLSPNYLNALCKKETGKSAIQLIHERILLEARRLLYSTSLSVKEISFSLNFEDVAYFNRFFKKNMLLTPLEYRQQVANS